MELNTGQFYVQGIYPSQPRQNSPRELVDARELKNDQKMDSTKDESLSAQDVSRRADANPTNNVTQPFNVRPSLPTAKASLQNSTSRENVVIEQKPSKAIQQFLDVAENGTDFRIIDLYV